MSHFELTTDTPISPINPTDTSYFDLTGSCGMLFVSTLKKTHVLTNCYGVAEVSILKILPGVIMCPIVVGQLQEL